MVFTDDIVRLLTGIDRQAAVGEMIADQALITGDPGAFKTHEREARKPAHVDAVGSKTGGSADRIVERKFDVRELLIPGILELVDHQCQHLGHHVIDTPYYIIPFWAVETGGNFPNPKKLADRLRKL